jgi:hypothetical protein
MAGDGVADAVRRAEMQPRTAPGQAEHLDVLIVGAGLSGPGGTCHLTVQCSDNSFVVQEVQDTFGDTWVPPKQLGIRSDSDLHTETLMAVFHLAAVFRLIPLRLASALRIA